MAKVSLNSLKLQTNKRFTIIDWEDQVIQVKEYLSIEEKLKLIAEVLNKTLNEDPNFYNPTKFYTFKTIAIIKYYTNINITEKQEENAAKLCDMLVSTGLYDKVLDAMCVEERDMIMLELNHTITSYYEYKNSIVGILQNVQQDYSNLDFDATEIQQKISDPENLSLLKDVLEKLG